MNNTVSHKRLFSASSQSENLRLLSMASPRSNQSVIKTIKTEQSEHPMYSVVRLQTFKKKPQFQAMSYREVSTLSRQFEPSQEATTNTSLPSLHLKTKSHIYDYLVSPKARRDSKKIEAGLDPSNLSATRDIRVKKKSNIPPEKRLIIVDDYLMKSQSPVPTAKNLEKLWHQTLGDTSLSLSKITAQENVLLASPGSSLRMKRRNSISSRRKELSESPARIDEQDPFRKDENHQHQKNAEILYHCIKDYAKLVGYAQKAIEQTKKQQVELHDFVMTFVEEIDYVERAPTKDFNAERLRTFQYLIESKYQEIVSQQDLLLDQINHIYDSNTTTDPKNPSKPTDTQTALLNLSKIEMNTSLNFSLMSTIETKQNLEQTLTRLQQRTEMVKEEVRKYQEERIESQKQRYKEKVHSALHRVTSAGIPTDQTILSVGSNNSPFQRGDVKRKSTKLKTSAGPDYLRFTLTKSNTLTDSPQDKSVSEVAFPFGEDSFAEENKTTAKKKVKPIKIDTAGDLDDNDEEQLMIHSERRNPCRELQIWFTAIVEELETHISRFKSEMKIFLRFFNPEDYDLREVPPAGKLIALQAQTCVDVLQEASLRYAREYTQKKKEFILAETAIFQKLEEIIRANILKLSSLKTLIQSSLGKLLEIHDYKNSINPVDMTDFDLQIITRREVQKMKAELNKNREAVLFLAQQVSKELPALQSIEFLNPEFLEALAKRMKNITRSMPFLMRLSAIDEDYARQVEQCIELGKKTSKQVEEINEFTQNKQESLVTNSLYEGIEQISNEITGMKKHVQALRNELNFYKAYTFFTSMLEPPVTSCDNMLRFLKHQEQKVQEYLNYLKSLVMSQYYHYVKEKESFETTFNAFISDELAKNQNYLRFEDWEKNVEKVKYMQVKVDEIKENLKRFHDQKYSQSIVLLPPPMEEMNKIEKFKSQTTIAIQLLSQGKILTPAYLNECFRGTGSENLREKLESLRTEVAEHIREKELIIGSPTFSGEPLFSMAMKYMQILVSLRALLKKGLQLCEKLNNLYTEFAFSYQRDPDEGTLAMKILIEGVRRLFQEFAGAPFESVLKEHALFGHLRLLFKEASSQEIELLKKLKECFDMVVQNGILFEEEIQSINQPYKFFNILDNWDEKQDSIQIAKNKMSPVMRNLELYEGNPYLRQELKVVVQDYSNNQAIMLNSIEACWSFLEIGKVFNRKNLAANLTARMRTDRSGILDFLNDLEENIGAIRVKTVKSRGKIEKSFELLIDAVMMTVVQTLDCLKIIDEQYSSLPSRLEKFRDRDPKNFVAVMKEAVIALKEMEKIFKEWIEGLEAKMVKKCGITVVIRSFLSDVLSKDVKVCEKLLIETKLMEAFIDREMKYFFIEDLAKGKFRHLSTRNIKEIEIYRDKTELFATHAGNYLLSPEIFERPALKSTVQELQDLFEGLRATLQVFCVFYKEGLEYLTLANKLFSEHHEPIELSNQLQILEGRAGELIRNVSKASDARRFADLIEERVFAIGIRSLIQDDILTFFEEGRRWANLLRRKLLGMVTFDKQMKNAYDGQVLLYQLAWIRFVEDLVPSTKTDFSLIFKSKNDYDDLKEKMSTFTEHVTREFIEMKESMIRKTIEAVRVLNTKFLTEKFFQMERRDRFDLITPKLLSLSDKMKDMKSTLPDIEKKMVKYVKNCDKVLEAIDFLHDPTNLKLAGFEHVMRLEVVLDYIDVQGLRAWTDLINFLLNQGMQLAKTVNNASNFLKEVESQANLTFFGKQMDMILGYYYTGLGNNSDM